jgi:alkylated DNA repair dioxygenase AlkB
MMQPMLIQTEPEGFRYAAELISVDQESDLIRAIGTLSLKEFEFQGYLAKRKVTSFGWHYDFGERELRQTCSIPDFLLPLRTDAASFAGIAPHDLSHALVTEYSPGTPIGWHRDRPVFGDVVGVSLRSACTFRFRQKTGEKWKRHSLILEPRSVYLLRGASRTDWEHSIPAVSSTRYSITFRSVRTAKPI